MKPASGKIRVYFFSSLFLAVVCAVLYILSYLTAFDSDIGYFRADAFLPFMAKAVLTVTLIWLASAFVFIPKGTITASMPQRGIFTRIISLLCAAAYAAYAVCRVFIGSATVIYSKPITFICTLLAFLSVLYFVFSAIGNTGQNTMILLGFLPIFRAALSMTEAYINNLVAMNSPVKVSLMLSMMSIMIYMLYELRYRADRPFPRAFAVFALAGICINAVFSIPLIINYFTGVYRINAFLPDAVLSLLMALYMIAGITDLLRTDKAVEK